MKKLLALVIIFSGVLSMSAQPVNNVEHNLMPIPQTVSFDNGKFYIDAEFKVSVSESNQARLDKAVGRFVQRLAGRTGFFLPQAFFNGSQKISKVQLKINSKKSAKVALGMDESYTLNISRKNISLYAKTDIGAMHGLETLLQLLSKDETGYYFPYVHIEDKPRFPWRGLLIDVCRHFMPLEVIKRNLDGMSAVKMNVLHWHLSEDQGFRVESKTHPKLHQMGSDGMYYTHEQVREIIQYADDRGIRVMPEFDLPGHATSWLVGYPELASAPGPYQIERGWGIFDPTMNPAIEETYTFLDGFFKEICGLFPDAYMHIGGDENNGKQWDANAQIQAFMKKKKFEDNHALQSYFNRRLLKILTKYNKKLMGWDEILHKDMPTNIVIQSWRGREAMIKAASEGYQTLLSNGYYIDLIQPTDFHYLNDPAPADLPLNAAQRKNILGGEATMWAEMISPETIDSRVWPRTAAIAERLWSSEDVKDVPDMYRRLDAISLQLEELGLTHEKNYHMFLRRLSGGRNIEVLKTLVDVIEPVKIYNRNRLRKQFSYTPLTRVVDAARPDAGKARKFREKVNAYLADTSEQPELVIKLRQCLKHWNDNHTLLVKLIKKSPVLQEIEPLSLSLANIAGIGLKVLDLIEQGQKADQVVYEESKEMLEQVRQPYGQCELMIVDGVEALLEKVK